MTEQFPNQNQEQYQEPIWVAEQHIDTLPALLGIIETQEMTSLHNGYVTARQSGDANLAGELITQYHILGQQVVEQHPAESYPKAQVGLMVSLAIVRRDAGMHDLFIADVLDAASYAENMGLLELKDALEDTMSSSVADTLRAYGEAYGFDSQTCNEVANQPSNDAVETAYGYLTQTGLDPETVLAPYLQDGAA